MGVKLDATKLIAEIAKLGAEVYGIVKDKKREGRDQTKDDKIHALETEVAELKRRLDQLTK